MKKKSNNQLKETIAMAQDFPHTALDSSARRIRSRAVELAIEEDREDRYARQTALQLAAAYGEPHELVVERAKAYFDFLRSQ